VSLFAQHSAFDFIHFYASDGLSQSSVIAISQDHNRLMWFGTRDGLNQFDGKEFKIFRSVLEDSTTISNNDILDLATAENGDLWIGTTNGLNRYDPNKEVFQRYYQQPNNSSSLTSNTIRALLINKEQVWIGTSDGLCILDLKTKAFRNFQDTPYQSLNGQIMEIAKDSNGSVWIGTSNGLVIISQDDAGQMSIQEIDQLKNVNIQAINVLNNKLYLGTKSQGLKILNIETKELTQEIKAPQLANNDIRALKRDAAGNLWIGTYSGLDIFTTDEQIIHLVNDENDDNSLSKNTIKSLFLDHQGAMWVGTYYGGINYWNPFNFNFRSLEKSRKGTGLSYNVVSAIESYESNLYMATEGGGITVIDRNKNYSYIKNETSKLPSKNIKILMRDEAIMLIGTFNAGLSFYNLKTKSIDKTLNTDNSLPHNSVYGLAQSKDYYWIGTFGGGLVKYSKASKNISTYQKISGSNSLSDNQVRVVFTDKTEGIWVGTQNGLNFISNTLLDAENISFQTYLYNPASQSGEDVLCIYQDSSDRLWVGTKENGLYLKTSKQFELIKLFSDIPNASNTVHSIEEGTNGDLWISSNNGILRYNPDTGEKQLFQESDGLISNEFNSNASFKDTNNTLYFGSPQGITYFSPEQMKYNFYAPKVVLTDFHLNGKKVKPLDITGILTTALSTTETIALAYDQSTFSVRFAMPNYVNPRKNSYSYRLKGLSEWTNSTSNIASYTVQEAGEYTFEVKGQNNDGEWSSQITALTIKVSPAPWRTPWAFAGYTLLIITAIYFLAKTIQTRDKLENDLMLEHESNEREKLVNKLKLQFFTNISHEFRTPLTLILGPLQQIIAEYRGSSKLYKQIITVEKNANQLFKLINQLMDFRKLENNESKLATAEGNIVKFTKEVFVSFQNHAKNEGYKFNFTSGSDELLIYYDRDKMERVLYNIISNAFKFTSKKGSINISISDHLETISITVSDSGAGIESIELPRIFDRFYQVHDSNFTTAQVKGTGIGLALVKGLVALHSGTVAVKSEGLGKGASFVINLPKGSNHLESNEIIENFRDSENLERYTEYLKFESPNELEKTIDSPATKFSKKLLIVEDNPELRNFIVSLLNEYTILEAANGREGLEMAIRELPDLVISDVMMPEMDGIALCASIKEDIRLSHIPVILVTARTSLLFKYEGLESGADDYINKPFDIRELKIKVKNMISVTENLKNRFRDEKSITPSEVTLSSVDEELMKRAIKIVDANISNEFLDVLLFCTELGVSRTMLFTKLKTWTNLTPNEFIFGMRMKRAARLLEQGKVSVSSVCFEVGYKNPKYFSKSFQKYHGITPSKYAAKFKAAKSKDK